MKPLLKTISAVIGTIAAIMAIFMYGHSVGSGSSSALIELIKEDREKLRNQVSQLLNETESLKIQLSSNINSKSTTAINSAISDKGKPLSINKEQSNFSSEERDIQTQNTERFFGGDLVITLIATSYSGTPLRHKVLANVLIPGTAPLEIRDADPGSAFKLGEYQIVIVQSGTLSASFKVFKITTKN